MTKILTINKSDEIVSCLENEIDTGLFTEDEKLPTEMSLVKRFRTSRETVRKALKKLIEKGKIYSVQGSGYYVTSKELHMIDTLNEYSSITEIIRNANLVEGDLEMKISKRQATEEEELALELDKQEQVYVLERIRTANGESAVFSKNIIPESIVGADFPELFSSPLSFYLKQHHDLTISESMMEIKAVRSVDPLPEEFKQSCTPFLKLEQVHYDAKMKPIFLSCDYMRNDLIRFFVRRK